MKRSQRLSPRLMTWISALLALAMTAPAQSAEDGYAFDDYPRESPLEYPAWFKPSFLNLDDDLTEALAAGKRGLIVYFGQKRCAYCHKLMSEDWGLGDIVEYTKQYFDVVPVDIWGVAEVTDFCGNTLTEQEYSLREQAVFTPTLVFYGEGGKELFRLRGFYPPYQFRAALEYVADSHYQRESFRDYLARGENRMVFDAEDMNDEPFFAEPPYNLDRRYPSERPLAVFFEQGDCHACDVLHGQTLHDKAIRSALGELDSVQVNMWSDTPLVTPAGKPMTARQWSEKLGLFYSPSILFFDENGNEVLRVDSVAHFYRLRNVMNYITSKAYRGESYQEWRVSRNL